MQTPIPFLLEQLKIATPDYGRQMTQLSNFIVDLETKLLSMDAQVEAVVFEDPKSTTGWGLRFGRLKDGWALSVGHGHSPSSWNVLTTASVDEKIRAAVLFEQLIERMLSRIAERKAKFAENTKRITPYLATLQPAKTTEGK